MSKINAAVAHFAGVPGSQRSNAATPSDSAIANRIFSEKFPKAPNSEADGPITCRNGTSWFISTSALGHLVVVVPLSHQSPWRPTPYTSQLSTFRKEHHVSIQIRPLYRKVMKKHLKKSAPAMGHEKIAKLDETI